MATAIWIGPLREDKRKALVLQWTWQPTRTVSVEASARHEQRDSSLSGFDYKDTTLGLSVRGLF